MHINQTSCWSKPSTYGHVALTAALVGVALTVSLIFAAHTPYFETSLIGGVAAGGMLALAGILYLYSCCRKDRAADLRDQPSEDPSVGRRGGRGRKGAEEPIYLPIGRERHDHTSRREPPQQVSNSQGAPISRTKEGNVNIFRNTLEICKAGGYMKDGAPISIARMSLVQHSHRYTVRDVSEIQPQIKFNATAVAVVEGDSLDVALSIAQACREQGRNPPLVLSMANAHHMGGGSKYGAFTQEEELCRRTNLYNGLSATAQGGQKYYIPEDGGIYSPGVVVFKDAHGRLLDEPEVIGVASVAAYNLKENGRSQERAHLGIATSGKVDGAAINRSPEQYGAYLEGTKQKIRNLFLIAEKNGHTDLVLSALGCGDFENDPRVMSWCFSQILPEFAGVFNSVTFAIYVSKPPAPQEKIRRDQYNLSSFQWTFSPRQTA